MSDIPRNTTGQEQPDAIAILHDDAPIIIDDGNSLNVRCHGLSRNGNKFRSPKDSNALAIYRLNGSNVTAVGAFAPVVSVTIMVRGGSVTKPMIITPDPFDMDTSGEMGNFEPTKIGPMGRTIETLKNLGGASCRIESVSVVSGSGESQAVKEIDTSAPGQTFLVFSDVHMT